MSNHINEYVSLYQKLNEAVMGLAKALSAKSSSSEEEEIIRAEIGAGWQQVYKYLGEIEGFTEAHAQADTLQKVMFYITEVKGITLDDYDQHDLGLVVSEGDPYWYQPE